MGYYSEVALVLTAKGIKQYKVELNKLEPEFAREIESFSTSIYENYDDHEMLFHWANTKWYPSFPEVAFFEDLMKQLDEADYLFIRLGERSDDNEEKGEFYDNSFDTGIVRTISFRA